jgi:phenylalanyl-tRNA synthetase beta chain
MKVSLNTIKQYTDVTLPIDELVAKINAQLGGVEEVINLSERYENATIAKVISCKKHENADKLSVCEIDAGTMEYIQVVCGAPNVREGMFVVWLPPKSTVPASYTDKEPFVLDARELRGVMSHGMLASAKELGLGDSHDGILEVDPNEWKPTDVPIEPGTSFAKAYGLDDTIIDIENKMFTHRPDLFGQLGVAREIAGIQHKQFTSPEWYLNQLEFDSGEGLALEVFNDAPEKVPRFMAVAIKNVEIKPSPLWLQCELVRLGGKPINNVVDVTNYVMLLTAQPTHAYDYDKIRGHKIGTRMAKKGETVPLLNGKTYELSEDDIVIIDGEGPIGLGGIMGGGNSEVSIDTKNLVLEVANFDMYTVRKSSMRHGIFTDALTRFNKGQSPLQNAVVLNLLIKSIFDTAGGEQAGDVHDLSNLKEQDLPTSFIESTFVNIRLGLNLNDEAIVHLLENVEFEICLDCDDSRHSNAIHYASPFWRTDIELPEDIVEEIGRLYGFDKLPRELPSRSTKPAPKNKKRVLAQTIRESLARAGANEVLTYSFVHENVIKKAGQDLTHAYRLSNALSPDLQFYRLSLTPSLLDKVHMNVKAGYDQFALFELNKVHYKGEMDDNEPDVPNEDSHTALVITYNDKKKLGGSPYYQARTYLEQIVDLDKVQLVTLESFDVTKDEWGRQLTAPYEPRRSAVIVKGNQIWGVVGEYRQSVRSVFKLPEFTAGFEIHQDIVTTLTKEYRPLSRYPSTGRDICFQVAQATAYSDILVAVREALNDESIEVEISPVDIYQPEAGDTKNITIRLVLTSHLKTLSGDEVTTVIERVANEVVKRLNATVI